MSYAAFLLLAGTLLLAVVWLFLLRYVPEGTISANGGFVPNRADLIRAFAPRAALTLTVLAVGGVLGGWLLAGYMLAPLRRLGDGVRLAGRGDLTHRIRLQGRRDEIRDLADAVDGMLEQLEDHVEHQRRFAANASHELRTPLAITHALLDAARDDPSQDHHQLLAQLATVNTRAVELTSSLLLLARAEARSFDGESIDLSLLVDEVVETLVPLAEKRDIALTASVEVAWVRGDASLLLQTVTNLVHNAITHNLASGGMISIATHADGDITQLTVENTGRLVDPHEIVNLTEPFQRGAGRTSSSDHDGVGLGLAIVAAITRAHRGTLDLTPRPDGGLCVTITYPTDTHPTRSCS